MDDDIYFEKENAIETFLTFLDDYKPAVATTKYANTSSTSPQYTNDDEDVNTLGSIIDHCFIAFHKDTVHNLFPYNEKFKYKSIFYSHLMKNYVMLTAYAGYVLQCNNVVYHNKSMEDNTRSYKESAVAWKVPFIYFKENLKEEYHALLDSIGMLKTEPVEYIVKKKDIDYSKIKLDNFLLADCEFIRNNRTYWNECVK